MKEENIVTPNVLWLNALSNIDDSCMQQLMRSYYISAKEYYILLELFAFKVVHIHANKKTYSGLIFLGAKKHTRVFQNVIELFEEKKTIEMIEFEMI